MSQLPDGIDLPRHRDFEGRELGQWLRRGFLLLLLVLVVAALLNVFGQADSNSEAEGAAATLSLTAPTALRGGLYYQARFTIHAREAIGAPVLQLDRGWYEGTTVNTVEPEAAQTTSDEDHFKLRYPPLAPGRTLVVYLDLQANPTNIGVHDADVTLLDGDRPIATIDRSEIDWP
ncbi:MAG: hypothetical protein AB7P38_01075 [Solirubrobacterales bacterium]